MRKSDYKKHIISITITVIIVIALIFVSKAITENKLAQVKKIYDDIYINVLSIETQFELLKQLPCDKTKNNLLTHQIVNLGRKLNYMEDTLGYDDKEVIKLKKFYSLLQIKEMLLKKQISKKCDLDEIHIIYFYSNKNCDECQVQGYILTRLTKNYPQIRIYSFDYDLDLDPIKSLVKIYNITTPLPNLVVNNKTYKGINTYKQLENILEPLLPKKEQVENATSTEKAN